MTKTWIVETSFCKLCGKQSYEDEDDALYSTKSKGLLGKPYKCPYSNGWHLTSRVKGNHVYL